jgi:hypothetical protein
VNGGTRHYLDDGRFEIWIPSTFAEKIFKIQHAEQGQESAAPLHSLRKVSRHKLDRKDLADYAGDSVFHRAAQLVCGLDGVIPRKVPHPPSSGGWIPTFLALSGSPLAVAGAL